MRWLFGALLLALLAACGAAPPPADAPLPARAVVAPAVQREILLPFPGADPASLDVREIAGLDHQQLFAFTLRDGDQRVAGLLSGWTDSSAQAFRPATRSLDQSGEGAKPYAFNVAKLDSEDFYGLYGYVADRSAVSALVVTLRNGETRRLNQAGAIDGLVAPLRNPPVEVTALGPGGAVLAVHPLDL
ncbi:MAG TPA: hypothetical protein VGE07_11680 [Herpetosiphonaceae bacterium]